MEVVSSDASFAGLRREWKDLERRSRNRSVFLTWEWQHSWWESYRAHGSPKGLHLVLGRAPGGELAFLLPLYVHRSLSWGPWPLRVLRFIGSPDESSEYLDALCDRELDPACLFPALDRLVDSGADGLSLSDLRDDALLLGLVPAWAARRGLRARRRRWNTCPYLPLPAGFEEYLGTLSGNMRYHIRRRTRNFLKTRGAVIRRVEDEGEAVQAMRSLFDLHRRRRRSTRQPSRFGDDPHRQLFHERAALPMLRGGFLQLYLAEVGGMPAAGLYCFRQDGHVYYYQAGLDPAFEKMSLGVVLMGRAIERSIVEGATEFDFLRGEERYKLDWTGRSRETYLLETPFTARARWCRWSVDRLRRGLQAVRRLSARVRGRGGDPPPFPAGHASDPPGSEIESGPSCGTCMATSERAATPG